YAPTFLRSYPLLIQQHHHTQLSEEVVHPVHRAEGFEDHEHVHHHVAPAVGEVDVVAGEALDGAVEVEPDELEVGVDGGAAGVAADGVGGGDEVDGRREVEVVLGFEPALGELPVAPGAGGHDAAGGDAVAVVVVVEAVERG